VFEDQGQKQQISRKVADVQGRCRTSSKGFPPVDSTGTAARLDAEEWRDLVGAYLDAASAAVMEMGGKVAKKLSDGLIALFGYPVAQENDAERAVRAALAIQRALAELNRKNADTGKPALAACIAIESGPVVVDAAGEIFGNVPNIAARAQALAEPGASWSSGRDFPSNKGKSSKLQPNGVDHDQDGLGSYTGKHEVDPRYLRPLGRGVTLCTHRPNQISDVKHHRGVRFSVADTKSSKDGKAYFN